MRTLVVGAAIVDLMMKVERLPKSGEDIPCKETKTVVGGCAYNVANTLRNLNCEHDLCVPVGSGSFADIIRRGMKEKGYEPMIEEPGEDNGYCLSLVEADGERTFITVQGAECHFKKEWFEQIDMDNYENIYIAGYQVCGKNGEIISQWLKTVENVEEKHIFFAPGPMITAIESETMENLFALKPILHINEAEAKGYTQRENVEEAVKTLYEKSGNLVFVTLGAEGTLFYDGKEMRRVASVKTNVVDTVGAGDSHIGAIIAGMSKGMKEEDAVLLANHTAAAIVGTSGPVMDLEEFQKISEEWENE